MMENKKCSKPPTRFWWWHQLAKVAHQTTAPRSPFGPNGFIVRPVTPETGRVFSSTKRGVRDRLQGPFCCWLHPTSRPYASDFDGFNLKIPLFWSYFIFRFSSFFHAQLGETAISCRRGIASIAISSLVDLPLWPVPKWPRCPRPRPHGLRSKSSAIVPGIIRLRYGSPLGTQGGGPGPARACLTTGMLDWDCVPICARGGNLLIFPLKNVAPHGKCDVLISDKVAYFYVQ